MVSSLFQGETLTSPQVPGFGGHQAVRMVEMTVVERVVGMVVENGC